MHLSRIIKHIKELVFPCMYFIWASKLTWQKTNALNIRVFFTLTACTWSLSSSKFRIVVPRKLRTRSTVTWYSACIFPTTIFFYHLRTGLPKPHKCFLCAEIVRREKFNIINVVPELISSSTLYLLQEVPWNRAK